jgi:hypothetical protein
MRRIHDQSKGLKLVYKLTKKRYSKPTRYCMLIRQLLYYILMVIMVVKNITNLIIFFQCNIYHSVMLYRQFINWIISFDMMILWHHGEFNCFDQVNIYKWYVGVIQINIWLATPPPFLVIGFSHNKVTCFKFTTPNTSKWFTNHVF